MGTKNLRQFQVGLDKWAKQIEGKAVLFQKKVAFLVLGAAELPGGAIAMHSGLLQLTPVDTGRAVGNWQVSIGAPSTETGDKTFGSGGSGKGAAEAYASRRGVAKISGVQLGQSIWICNNLPYIVVLNDGAENRTAHHMLERAIDNARRAIRSR